MLSSRCVKRFFFFNDTATTEIYTLSLHDALPIYRSTRLPQTCRSAGSSRMRGVLPDRKSTRLNSSHANISYAVFCLKKKQHNSTPHTPSSYAAPDRPTTVSHEPA